MSRLYAGDLHGDLDAIKHVDACASKIDATAVVQVGDFGCLWLPGVDEYFQSRSSKIPWYTCGGNHENYDNWHKAPSYGTNMSKLLPNVYWVHRGMCQIIEGKNHLFLGGAHSIDKHLRVEGKTWWKQEMPTYQELVTFSGALDSQKPDVVVTHDGPQDIVAQMGFDWGSNLSRDLQSILDNSDHSPANWYFGHYHAFEQVVSVGYSYAYNNDEKFACCGVHGEFWVG